VRGDLLRPSCQFQWMNSNILLWFCVIASLRITSFRSILSRSLCQRGCAPYAFQSFYKLFFLLFFTLFPLGAFHRGVLRDEMQFGLSNFKLEGTLARIESPVQSAIERNFVRGLKDGDLG